MTTDPSGAHAQMVTTPTTVVIAAQAPPGSSFVFRAACSLSLGQTCSATPEALPTPTTQSQRLNQEPGSQESENRPASVPLTPAVTHTPGLSPVACSHLWSGVTVGSVQGAWHHPSGLPGPLTLAPEWPLFLQGQNLLYCCLEETQCDQGWHSWSLSRNWTRVGQRPHRLLLWGLHVGLP